MPERETHTLDVTPGLPMSLVREFVLGVDGHLPDRARETLALLVTELASNAVRHGEPPAQIEVIWLAGTARLVVRSSGPPFRWRGPRPLELGGGLGLVLVDGMADRWGIRRSRGGNEVWVELDHY